MVLGVGAYKKEKNYLSHMCIRIIWCTIARTTMNTTITGQTGFRCIGCNTIRPIVTYLTFLTIDTRRVFLKNKKIKIKIYGD